MEDPYNRIKPRERGYTVVWISFVLLVMIDFTAGLYLYWITRLNYEIIMMDLDNIALGFYNTVYPTFDTTIVAALIGSFNIAFPIVANAQLKKKAKNNNFEYLELYMDRWMSDPEIRPYAAQIFQSFLTTNNI